jgi:hypothetical protein
MKHCINYPASRIIASVFTVMIVFGFAILMVIERYNPAVITTVVTGTSLAAAELVRRLQAPASPPADPDHTPTEHS